MNPLNPFFAIFVYIIVFLTAYLLRLKFKTNINQNRFETIDGLRGFLAIGVFIHHSVIWHQYFMIGEWKVPNSNLYTHLGQTTVAIFFMITSFLFVSKLLNLKTDVNFDWKHFFISRIFRLTPMYYLLVILMVLVAFIITDFSLKVDVITFLKSLFYWFSFTIITSRRINEVPYSLNAGVNWSLPFEWLFYFSLPLISLLILKNKPSKLYLFFALFFVIGFFAVHGFNFYILSSFFGGAIAPVIIKFNKSKFNFDSNYISVLLLILLFLILQFTTADHYLCKLLITILFTLICLGNTFFGILKNQTLKFLGDISYSTYLLHGIILFSLFYFGIGFEKMKLITPLNFCLLVFSISPLIVIFSFIGFKYIENPFIVFSKKNQFKSK